MSLVVSMRVPDGIVVAADSLSLSHTQLQVVADIEMKCPHCEKTITGPSLRPPPVPIPFSASSYTQKLFSLYNVFALGSIGQGIVNGRSIYYHIKQFELSYENSKSLVKIRDAFITYLEKELLNQFPKYKKEAPEDWHPLGFHLNGYEEIDEKQIGVTYEVHIGRKNIKRRRATIGCTIAGDLKVVQKLWEIGKEDQRLKFKYPLFSLQDAIDLSEFLITATGTFQRFANEVPTVGGEVDIALVTPFEGFQWIKRKKLMKTLEEPK